MASNLATAFDGARPPQLEHSANLLGRLAAQELLDRFLADAINRMTASIEPNDEALDLVAGGDGAVGHLRHGAVELRSSELGDSARRDRPAADRTERPHR